MYRGWIDVAELDRIEAAAAAREADVEVFEAAAPEEAARAGDGAPRPGAPPVISQPADASTSEVRAGA
jgi:hypothetical protein